jgi:ABC-type lipopolysaccharide export system ATPase subunit
VIEAHQLTKRYGDKAAVEDLSFTVHPGVVTGFLGPKAIHTSRSAWASGWASPRRCSATHRR